MTDWTRPRPDPVRPVGLTVYCTGSETLHKVCPGYSTTPTNETLHDQPATCGCTCHQETT